MALYGEGEGNRFFFRVFEIFQSHLSKSSLHALRTLDPSSSSLVFLKARSRRTTNEPLRSNHSQQQDSCFSLPSKLYMAKTLFTKTKKRFPLPREIRTGKNHQKPCSSCCPTFIKFTYHNLYRLPTNILEQTTPTAK